MLILFTLLACSDGDPVESADPTASDPRWDPANWPERIDLDDRTATLVAPTSWAGEALPVVFELHGFSASGQLQDLIYQASLRVDEKQFILVLPEGTKNPDGLQFWNATDACCDFYGSEVNDVRFLKQLIDEVEASFPVDSDRISIMGHSNGGYMSYRMGCEIPTRLSAIAPLAGLAWSNEADCVDQTGVSVLHIHGTLDTSVPYEPAFGLPGALGSVERHTARAGCSGTSEDLGAVNYEEGIAGDETDRLRFTDGCREGFVGELWTMNETGHVPLFTDEFRDDMLDWMLARTRQP